MSLTSYLTTPFSCRNEFRQEKKKHSGFPECFFLDYRRRFVAFRFVVFLFVVFRFADFFAAFRFFAMLVFPFK
jgi:hypothetical protein